MWRINGMKDIKSSPGGLTVAAVLVAYAYAALSLALPFLADANPPPVMFVAIWIGGSALAGALAPHRWIFVVPLLTFMVLTFLMLQGYTESDFLSDPLSIIALFTLTAGELVGAAVGYTVVSAVRSGKNG